MKLVVAVIHPVRLRAVKEVLDQIEVQRITICDAQEWISHDDFATRRNEQEFQANFRRMITLEIAVNDDFLERTIASVNRVCALQRGDTTNSGVICVIPIDDVRSFFPEKQGPGAI